MVSIKSLSGLGGYTKANVQNVCNIIRDPNGRAKCFVCGEKMDKGDKVIQFITGSYWNHINRRRCHIICWLSCVDEFPSSKEMGMSKRVEILRNI